MKNQDIYKMASFFYKKCSEEAVDKRWIQDCFFGTFGQKYNLLYDYFESEKGWEVDSDVYDIYGASIKFRFLDKTKDDPENISNIVEAGLKKNSPMAPYIHWINVTPVYGHVYEVSITFNPAINEVMV